jgi:hypothetical protein
VAYSLFINVLISSLQWKYSLGAELYSRQPIKGTRQAYVCSFAVYFSIFTLRSDQNDLRSLEELKKDKLTFLDGIQPTPKITEEFPCKIGPLDAYRIDFDLTDFVCYS